ncbi:MAG: recombinase RecJ, partial [Candidatus Omnitrophica bacterium]|nr:recombinase RecJ [Candidatus Omnitrophota bacterium]
MSNKKRIDQLVKHLENEEKVYIQTHNFPDPDAIASAFGLQYLLKKYGISSEIIYDGQLQSNPVERMISEFGISIYHYSEVKMMQNSKIVIVDGCKGNKNVTDLMGIK